MQDLLTKLDGAEVVGGNVIHGILADRAFVGKVNESGVFEITEIGHERLAALESPAPAVVEEKPKTVRAKKETSDAAE
jgi:hypothetical protein